MMLSKKTIYLASASSIAAIFIIVCVAVFAIGPQHRAIENIENVIHAKEAEVVKARTSEHDSSGDVFQQTLSSACQNLSRYVISLERVSEFAVDINRIAKQAGVQDLSITNRMQGSYGSINECRHIREGRIQIKFKSSFSQFAKFINSLERYKPVIFVDSFDIKHSTSDDSGHTVDMVLVFFVGQDSLKDIMDVGTDLNNVGEPAVNEIVVN